VLVCHSNEGLPGYLQCQRAALVEGGEDGFVHERQTPESMSTI